MTGSIRVLHLEDSPRDAELIREKLAAEGLSCDIVLVDRKETFESALARDSFDVILCDYNLPDYDGRSALTLAKETQPETPVIVISGTLGEEAAVECLRLGATDYLLKDRLERLAAAVSRALQEAEEHRKGQLAEEQLRRSEERFRSLIENASDLIAIVDREGSIHYASPSHVRVLGYRPEEMIGQAMLTFVHPDDHARVGSALRQAVENPAAPLVVEFR